MNILRSLSIGILISIVIVQQVKSWNIIDDIDIIDDQIRRYRRSPKLFVPRCQINQYFDKEERRCLSIAGGGNLVYIDKRRSCGMDILKPDCTNDKYYYICKGNRTILAECAESQRFENRVQKCVFDELKKSNVSFIRPENDESLSNHIEAPVCEIPGRFPVPGHCTLFYTCETNGLRMFQNIFQCPKDMGYDSEKEICTFFSTCGNLNPETFSQICLPSVDEDSQSAEELTEESQKSADAEKESEDLKSTVYDITLVENGEHSTLSNYETSNTEVISNDGEFTSPLAPIIAEDIPQQSVDFPDNSDIAASSETHFSEKSRSLNTEDSSTVASHSTRNANEEYTTLSENLSSTGKIGKIELAESSSSESLENLSSVEENQDYGTSTANIDDSVEEAGEEMLDAIEETTYVNSETTDYTSEVSPMRLSDSTVESGNDLEESLVDETSIGSLSTSDSNDLTFTEPKSSEVATAINDFEKIESIVSTEENDLLTQTENADATHNIGEQSTIESSDLANSESVSDSSAVSNDHDAAHYTVDATENVSEVSFTEDKVSDENEGTIKDSVSVSTIQSGEEGISDDSASLIGTTSAYYANYDTTISPNQAEETSENSEAETSFSSATESSLAYTESASDDSSVFTTSSVMDQIPDLFTMIPSIIHTFSPSVVPLSDSETATSDSETATSESEAVTSASEAVASESEAVTSASDAVASESEAVTSESAAVTSESEAMTSESAAVTSEYEAMTSESAAVTSESEAVTSESEAVASESEAVTSASDAVASESEAVTSESAAVTSESEAMTSESAAVTSESEAVTSESEAVASESAAVTSESEAVTSESEAVASESEAVTSASDAVASESEAVTSESAAVTSESKAMTSESAAVTSESEAVTSESEAVASESEAVTSASDAVASESEAVASESAVVTSESAAVTSESEAMTSESAAVTSESEAMTSESAAMTSESEAVTSESEAVTSESETVASDSNNEAGTKNIAATLETSSNSAEATSVANDQLSSVQNEEDNPKLVTEEHYTSSEYSVKVNEPKSDNVRMTDDVVSMGIPVTEAEESGRLVSDYEIPILTIPSTVIESEESTENSYADGEVFTSAGSELYSANDSTESETILIPSILESHSVAGKINDKLVSSAVTDDLLEVTTKHKDITKNYLTLSKKLEPQNSQHRTRPLKSRVAKIANKFEKRLRNIFGRVSNRKLRQEDE